MTTRLNHSPADVVATLLVALGLGTDPSADGDWPVNAAGEAGSPDAVITVFDTGGTSDGRIMVGGEAQLHEGFQVRVRAGTHKVGWDKANAIRTALGESVYDRAVVVETSHYLVHCVTRISPVIALGKEAPASRRSLFTLNATLVVTQTA